MTELLKKYLLIKWWIPLLLFGISLFLFLKTLYHGYLIFLFILILCGLILLVSSLWQMFKGSKTIGLLQFFVLATPIVILAFIFFLFAGMMYKPDSKLSHENIEFLIKDKTDLILPKEFEVLENKIQHTEGAFDTDYSIYLTIEYKNPAEKYITEQILNSALFDTINSANYADPIWDIIQSKTDKGIWISQENGFKFLHADNDKNRAEPFYLTVDTLTNRIELHLIHL